MKRRIVLTILLVVLGGICVNAQRPVGDTIIMGSSSDYWYDSLYLDTGYIVGYIPSSNRRFIHKYDVDYYWNVTCPIY